MSQLRPELLKMSFPRLEDKADQDFGEATWKNAVDMVIAYVGHGYDLTRRNKVKLHSRSAEANRFNQNRWRTVHSVCEQGGTPDKRGLTGRANAPVKKSTKNTTTKKTSLCLHHNVDSEDGRVEHEPPRKKDNAMTPEMVQQEDKMLRLLHFEKNDTKSIHRTVERYGLILGPRGKQQVNFSDAFPAAMAAIQRESSRSRHKLCLFHMDENVRKHSKGLGEGVLPG
eukprot:jgi/Undpi1/4163/HiC_scaffold_16.g07530.m1